MNAHRMDQETAERLLGGPVVDPVEEPGPLVALLTAVRAAPRPDELRGENAAMQAYRTARAELPLPVPARPTRTGALARLAGLKVALAALAVTATGGMAVAAATGTLPEPLRVTDDRPDRPSAVPGVLSPTSGGPPASTAPSAVESRRPAPAASIVGLCRAYRAASGNDPGRALDNPVFSDLITTAGGREKVAGYCEEAAADPRTPAPPRGPATDRPGSAPTARPGGKPSPDPAGPTATSDPGASPTPGGSDVPAPAQSRSPGPDTR